MTPQPGDILLVLRPSQDAVPLSPRLRRLLKILLRVYRFKAVRIEEIRPRAGMDGTGVIENGQKE